MTTETAPDPTIQAWSDNLEEELVEAGMEQPQAKAYRHAFELGLPRVISQTATRQELLDDLAELRRTMVEIQSQLAQTATKQDLRDYGTKQDLMDARDALQREIAGLRSEMRFLVLFVGGIVTALLSALIAIVA